MKHKLMMRYSLISALLVVVTLCLLGLPRGDASAEPPEPTPGLVIDIRTRLQPYQTQGVGALQSDVQLLEEAPLSSETEELPISALGQRTFYAIADATVLQGYPSVNLGDTADMWVGYDKYLEPDGKIARSLVKFNIAGLPSNQVITKATLRVRLISSWDYPGNSHMIRTYRITRNWSESGVTWNNKPGYGNTYGSRSIPHGAWGWYEFDVTDLVRAWYDGTYTNYGIMLRGPEYLGWRGFATRESSYKPQLVVKYDIPTPTPTPTEPIPPTPPPTPEPEPTVEWKTYFPSIMKEWSPPTPTPMPPTPTPTPTSTPTPTPGPGVVPEPGTWYCYPSGSLTIRFTVSPDSGSVSNGKMTASCGSKSITGPAPIENNKFTLSHSDGINFISATFDDVDRAHGSFGFWVNGSCWAIGTMTCRH